MSWKILFVPIYGRNHGRRISIATHNSWHLSIGVELFDEITSKTFKHFKNASWNSSSLFPRYKYVNDCTCKQRLNKKLKCKFYLFHIFLILIIASFIYFGIIALPFCHGFIRSKAVRCWLIFMTVAEHLSIKYLELGFKMYYGN